MRSVYPHAIANRAQIPRSELSRISVWFSWFSYQLTIPFMMQLSASILNYILNIILVKSI